MTTTAENLISPREAHEIASQWGSFMTAGDPGAVFYTFHTEDATPQGPDHRAALLAYTESLLARESLSDEDRAELESLKAFFTHYPATGEETRAAYHDESAALLTAADEFSRAYVEAAVFCGVEYPEDHPDAGHDKNYDLKPNDVTPDALKGMFEDCARFQQVNADLLAQAYARPGYDGASQAGHDFWLNRNGHGAGFWDRDALDEGGLGERLSAASKLAGESDLYQGDDGGIYVS